MIRSFLILLLPLSCGIDEISSRRLVYPTDGEQSTAEQQHVAKSDE